MVPRIVDGLDEVVEDHDLFVVDQWGVLHDGHRAHPGAARALRALQERGTVVLVSNTSRRVADNRALLARLGFVNDLWDGILTAGEQTVQALLRDLPGARVLCVGEGTPADHALRGLAPRLTVATDVEDADALAVMGLGRRAPRHLDPVLLRAIERELPLYCFNPDIVSVQPDGSLLHCPGAVAQRYEELGGTAHRFGKPLPLLYAQASAHATGWRRGLAIGDSLHHDVQGGRDAGLDTVLLTRGIHWADCGAPLGDRPSAPALARLCAREGITPSAALARFVWSAR